MNIPGTGTINESEPALARRGSLIVFALLLALAIVLFDLLDGILYLGDIDDELREIQIRLLVGDASWFERTIPVIQMPEAYISPWSRLVDLPYALIAWALSPAVGVDQALNVAFLTWPLVLLFVFCILVVQTLAEMLKGGIALERIGVAACLLLMVLALWEFTPGRIDHHNVQLVLMMLVFYGLSLWTPVGALLAGIGLVLSVAVGLELLPLVAMILSAVSLCWMLDRTGSRMFAIVLGLSIAAGAPLFALLLIGPAGIAATECDAYSAPYVLALAGYGLITAGLAAGVKAQGFWMRGLLLGVPGMALIGALALGFPLCLDGPYQMIDPLARTLWLDRVDQEFSVLQYLRTGRTTEAGLLGVLIVVLLLAAPGVASTVKQGRSGPAIIYLSAVTTLVLALVQTRYIRFPIAFTPLFLPYVMHMAARHKTAGLRSVSAAAIMVLAIGGAAHFLIPVERRDLDAVDYLAVRECPGSDMSVLSRVPPGRIMAPAYLGLDLARNLPSGTSVAGIPFHRSAPGMRRIFQVFVSGDSDERRSAVGPFDYLAVCSTAVPDLLPDDTLFAVVARGGDWPGLTRIEPGADNRLQLFRIDHAAFR